MAEEEAQPDDETKDLRVSAPLRNRCLKGAPHVAVRDACVQELFAESSKSKLFVKPRRMAL